MITPPRVPHLPSISHLQFFVLKTLRYHPASGETIRAALAARRIKRSDPTVNQATRRLEAQGLIRGWYTARMVGDFAVRERHYEITVPGMREHEEARAFHTMPKLELVP